MVTGRIAGLAAFAVSVLGQLQTVDTGRGITIGFAIPDVYEGLFDVIVSISAPADAEWAGVAWGSGTHAPLTIVYPEGGSDIDTLRVAGYVRPTELRKRED